MPDLILTKDEFREARRKLRLSAQRCALLLGVADGRTIRRWEADQQDIPAAAQAVMWALREGKVPDRAQVAAWLDGEQFAGATALLLRCLNTGRLPDLPE